MANPLENGQSANLPSEETTPQEEPLGIRNPLLSPTPLGQRFLLPKFMLPIGVRPLSSVDFSTFSLDDTLVQGFRDEAFWDSPFLDESPSNLGSTPLATPLTKPESASPEKAATSSKVVQPQIETSPPKSQTSAPRNLTRDTNELEATTSNENSSSSLPIFKTQVPRKEITVQKAEVPEVTKLAQPSVVDVRESSVTSQPKITPQSNENIPVDLTKSTQPSVTNVTKSPVTSQPKITPQSDANIPATKSELSLQRSQTSLPITESGAIVSELDEIIQPQERTQETVESPSIQRMEASSQAKEPTHQASTAESDRPIALTTDVHETFAPSELTENSTEAESLVQKKATSELTPSITPGLDESASEKRQEPGNKRQESPSNSLDLTPDPSRQWVHRAAARSDASDATEAASVTSEFDPFPVNDRATTSPEQGLPITTSQESLVQREEANSEVTASNDSPLDAASANASASLDLTVSRVDRESIVQRAKTLPEGTASTQALETTELDQSAPKLKNFTSANPTTSATAGDTPIQRSEDFQPSVAPVLDDSTPDNSPTTQSNYTEATVEKDSVVQRSVLPSEDITRKESIGAVSESSAIAPSEARVVTAQNQHPVPPNSDTSTSEPKTLTSANETTSVTQGESLVQRSQASEVAQPTPPIRSAIPELVKSLVQRAKSRSEDSESTEPVTSKVDESGASAGAITSSNITTNTTPQADQSFPASSSGESLVQRETASSEVTAPAEPLKSAGDILHASSSAPEETLSAVAGESRVQRQVAPPEVTQSSDSVASAIDTFTPKSSAIPKESITISPETTAPAAGESRVQRQVTPPEVTQSSDSVASEVDKSTTESRAIPSGSTIISPGTTVPAAGESRVQRQVTPPEVTQSSDSVASAIDTFTRESSAIPKESITISPETTATAAGESRVQRQVTPAEVTQSSDSVASEVDKSTPESRAIPSGSTIISPETTVPAAGESRVQRQVTPPEVTELSDSVASAIDTFTPKSSAFSEGSTIISPETTAPAAGELRVQRQVTPPEVTQSSDSVASEVDKSTTESRAIPSGSTIISPETTAPKAPAELNPAMPSKSSTLEMSTLAPSVTEDSLRLQRTESPTAEVQATTSLESSQISALEPSGIAPTEQPSTTTTADSVVQRAESSRLESSGIAPASETPSVEDNSSGIQTAESPIPQVRATSEADSVVQQSESSILYSSEIVPTSESTSVADDSSLVQRSQSPVEPTPGTPSKSSTIKTSTLASSSEAISRIEGNSLVQRREAPAGERRAATSSESVTPDAKALASTHETPAVTEDSSLVQRVESPEADANAIAPASETTSIQRRSEKVSADQSGIALTEHLESASVESVSEPTSVPLEEDTTLADRSFPIQRKTALPDSTRPQTLISKPVTPEPTETTHTDQSLIQRKTETQTPTSKSKQTLEEVAPITTDLSSTSESISELTTPASQTVAQLLSENKETPQLPRVLKNLATTKHLGGSKSLVQKSEFLRASSPVESSENPMTNRKAPLTADLSRNAGNRSFTAPTSGKIPRENQIIQRQAASQPTGEIPESWSSLEQLLGQSNTPESEPVGEVPTQNQIIQRQVESQPTGEIPESWSSLEQLLGESHTSESEPVVVQTFTERRHSAKENHQLSQNQSNVRSSKPLPSVTRGVKAQKPIEANTKLKEAISIRKKESVQPIKAQDIEQVEENTLPKVTVKREEKKTEENVPDNLDALAREIYCLVRQRLEIERERHHGLYYSGRLPW